MLRAYTLQAKNFIENYTNSEKHSFTENYPNYLILRILQSLQKTKSLNDFRYAGKQLTCLL